MKMKQGLVVIAISASIVCFNALSQTSVYIPPSQERQLVSICKAIKSNSKLQLNRALKNARVKLRDVEDGLKCNGKSAIDYALSEKAWAIAKRISPELTELHIAKIPCKKNKCSH